MIVDKIVHILGTPYTIHYKEFKDSNIDGYCDYTSKEIGIRTDNTNNVGNFKELQNKQLRHEIIHAFLSESGLQANFQHVDQFGHEETMIDWVAIQYPKLLVAFRECGCI